MFHYSIIFFVQRSLMTVIFSAFFFFFVSYAFSINNKIDRHVSFVCIKISSAANNSFITSDCSYLSKVNANF